MAKNQRENKEYETTPQAVDPTFTPLASTTGSSNRDNSSLSLDDRSRGDSKDPE